MGLLDKLKHFAGGHGVKSQITRIENQDPEGATFPVGDSVMKFNVLVTAEKDEVTILKHDYEVWIERTKEEDGRCELIARDTHDKETDIIGADIKWPYVLAAGETAEDGCCIGDVDVKQAMKKLDIESIEDAEYRFYVRFIADVKGSPLDSTVEASIKLVP